MLNSRTAIRQNSTKRQIDVLVTIILSQPVVDVEDIIVVLIVIALVVHRFAWLGEHAPRIVRRFILELGIADVVRLDDVRRELFQRLYPVNGRK